MLVFTNNIMLKIVITKINPNIIEVSKSNNIIFTLNLSNY